MKKSREILTGTLLVMTLAMMTGCGNNGNNTADESGVITENETDANVDENPADTDTPETDTPAADDGAVDNGDTMSEGTDSAVDNNADTDANDGTVSGELGNGVKDLGNGVGDAVEDVGDAVGNAVEGR